MSAENRDVVVLGGGVIGLTTALILADRGASVALIESQHVGQEASWAGAGMLPPGNLSKATTPESRLRSYSAQLWPGFTDQLFQQTGIDNGYHICGAIDLATSDQLENPWLNEGVECQHLLRADLEQHIADLNTEFDNARYLPQFAQVRNPRHLKSLRRACVSGGVDIIEQANDAELIHTKSKLREVRIHKRRFHFDQICLCAGAWTASILKQLRISVPVRPVRGQIVQLQRQTQPFRCVIEQGRRYIVPRRDGLLLIGSTEEDVGFVKQNTPEEIASLLRFATDLVPSLSEAQVVKTWSGLRPGTPDELPIIGSIPEFENLYVGAGHFRSGLQMSVGTGHILADLMIGRRPEIPLEGLTVERFLQPTTDQARKGNLPCEP